MIHLDASFLVYATICPGSPESNLTLEWLRSGEILGMSAIAWAEYQCGKPPSNQDLQLARRIVARQIDFTEEMAALTARLFNETGRRRRMFTDCMIAATAIAEQASIATANLKDFRKFERFGLILAPTSPH